MNCVVAIATTGRPEIVADTVRWLLADPRKTPDQIVICGASSADVPASLLELKDKRIKFVISEKGLTRQRNTLLNICADADVVIFLDDDFLIADGFIDGVRDLFEFNPDIVMATGNVLADGIKGPGLEFEDGRALLGKRTIADDSSLVDVYNGYGCNMAVRMAPILEHKLRFDEKLPLYGWLEDVDFSRQLARFGRIVRSSQMRGVHLGTKQGRTNGIRLGYSQIANPNYLISKQSMRWDRAVTMMFRNIASNLVRSAFPEPWVDRRGRFKGNLLAIADLLRGRLHPERVLALP